MTDRSLQVASAHRRHVRCDCRPVRPPQPSAERGHRSPLAEARDSGAVADRARARAGPVHRDGGPGDRGDRRAAAGRAASWASISRRRCCASGRKRSGARRQEDRIALVRGDATRIPLEDGVVDAITIGFGIRNVENTAAACDEMRRVLAPGRPHRHSRVRDSGDAGRADSVSVVLQPRPAVHRPADFPSQRGVRLPAGVGWRLRLTRRVRDNPAAARIRRCLGRPADLRHRLFSTRGEGVRDWG